MTRDEYKAMGAVPRALFTIETLQRLGKYTPRMTPRPLTDDELEAETWLTKRIAN